MNSTSVPQKSFLNLKTQPSIRIRIGNVNEEAEKVLEYCDSPSHSRVADLLRGDISNPNFGLLKSVTVFPVPHLIGKAELIEQIESAGLVSAHPDVLFRTVKFLSGEGIHRSKLRRLFLADVRTILCLETTKVPGRGQVNIVCGQVCCDRVGGQRPFSIDYMDGVMRIPGGIYHVLVMNQ